MPRIRAPFEGPLRISGAATAALRALLLQAWRERDGLAAERERAERERDEALAQNERLQALLAKLQRMQFGPRSERLPG